MTMGYVAAVIFRHIKNPLRASAFPFVIFVIKRKLFFFLFSFFSAAIPFILPPSLIGVEIWLSAVSAALAPNHRLRASGNGTVSEQSWHHVHIAASVFFFNQLLLDRTASRQNRTHPVTLQSRDGAFAVSHNAYGTYFR